MRTILSTGIVMLFFGVAAHAAGDIFQCKDPKNGRTIFSDKPCPGGQIVELPPGSTFTAPPPPPATGPRGTPSPEAGTYRAIAVASPQSGETLRSAPGIVNVTITLVPGLQPDHAIRLQLDGSRLPDRYTSTSITLEPVDRGERTLQAEVVDAQDRQLLSSQPVTFFLHRPTAR